MGRKYYTATFTFLLKNRGDSMNYIYCYKNKINDHRYIGQTNNLSVRYSAHKSQAYNPNSKDYNCLFHKKIREYGLENFEFYVLEEIEDKDSDYIDCREQFWIEEFKTWCRYNIGYNQTTGGRQFKRTITLDEDSIVKIKELLKATDSTLQDIANQFNTYRECISRINTGRYSFSSNEIYPLRVTRNWKQVPQEVKEEIAGLLINTKITYKEIAQKYSISEHLINLINTGKSNLEGNYSYPLRKANQHLTKEQEDKILKMLKENKSNIEIALEVGVHRDTVSRRKKKYKF